MERVKTHATHLVYLLGLGPLRISFFVHDETHLKPESRDHKLVGTQGGKKAS